MTSAADSELEAVLGHTFQDADLLRVALTHRSYSNERGLEDNYERLEFLGDAVLGLITSRWLYRQFPKKPEGELSKLKSYLVSATVLADYAREIGLGARLRLGVGEDRSGGRGKASILCDAVEALIGAVFIDGGLKSARVVVEPILEAALEARTAEDHTDFKTMLQELSQARGWGLPIYSVRGESGPDHRKVFTVECSLEGRVSASAAGRSKKSAAQRAASLALAKLDLLPGRP